MENLYSEFLWWVGVVEDRFDPLFLGRCKVRIAGYHTPDTTQLPTADLPWAYPLQPITSAAISGIGTTPVGPVEGTWVMGFFRDGEDCQEPVMMGTMGGFPKRDYFEKLRNTSNYGFQDPTKNYPLADHLDEPDTNRLARNQNIDSTIVKSKRDARITGVETAMGGETWDEPTPPYGPRYPYNHVTYTEAGHAVELDDTPGSERLHIYHSKGTYVEVDAAGTMTRRIVGNDYHIVECNGYISIQGNANVTVEGACNVYVKGNCNMEVDGKLKTHVHGDYELNVAGKIDLIAGKDINIDTKGKVDVVSSSDISVNSGSNLKLEAATKTSITSPITAGNIFQGTFKGAISVSPPQPVPYVAGTPADAVEERQPQEPVIIPPGFKLSPEQRAEALAEAEAARALGTPEALEYAALKQAEADTGVAASATAPAAPQEGSNCELAQKVIDEAKKYVGMLETGARAQNAKNTGGGINPARELPPGQAGIIDEMIRGTGLNNAPLVKNGGEGYHWCAAFVTHVWKSAGAETPSVREGPASCDNWVAWGRKKGLLSDTPSLGAACIYFRPENPNDANHIGVVVGLNPLTTIEGNTNGGGAFSRNGAGCFVRTPGSGRKKMFVRLPDTCQDLPPAGTQSPPVQEVLASPSSDCLSAEMKAYLQKLTNTPTLNGRKLPASILNQLPAVICQFGINTPTRLAHFLSQCAHESINFTAVEEKLNYGAKGLRTTFGQYFKTDEIAREYERQPQRIANRAYANRIGNGPESSGDGWKYRGRGYIQLTGRANYAAFDKFVPEDILANPDLVATKYPLLSAAWFWTKAKPSLNDVATSRTDEAVRKVTKLVNGGDNGLRDREEKFDKLIALA